VALLASVAINSLFVYLWLQTKGSVVNSTSIVQQLESESKSQIQVQLAAQAQPSRTESQVEPSRTESQLEVLLQRWLPTGTPKELAALQAQPSDDRTSSSSDAPAIESYKDVGRGQCVDSSDVQVQHCQKGDVPAGECKKTCDSMAGCVAYNPDSHGSWCFIHYKDTWDGGSWTDSTACYNTGNSGDIVRGSGERGGTCYLKMQAAPKPMPASTTEKVEAPSEATPRTTDAPSPAVFLDVGSGQCADKDGMQVQHCQKDGVPARQCEETCSDMDECVAYNPESHGTWCFIHYKDAWDGGSFSDSSSCFNTGNGGAVVKGDGQHGGKCYLKTKPAHKVTPPPPSKQELAQQQVQEALDRAKLELNDAREAYKKLQQENTEFRDALKKGGMPTNKLGADVDQIPKAALDRFGRRDSVTQQLIQARSFSQKQYKSEGPPKIGGRSFDITINSFKRDKFVEYSIKEYVKCHHKNGGKTALSHIWIVWNDNRRKIPESLRKFEKKYDYVTFFTPSGADRISNRFEPLNFTSDAIFHVDDDMLHTCPLLDDMFELWRTDPDGMVGTSPRKKDLLEGGLDCWACPIVWGEYNIVFLTKGAFIHRRFLEEYWKPVWKEIRDVVDQSKCAEDFLMSAVHASQVGPYRAYAIAGSVNRGKWMVKETRHLARLLNIVEEFSGLNTRTWAVRGQVMDKISNFLKKRFKKQAEKGYFSKLNKQWWRSNANPDLSCREQTVACYNRAWDSCAAECDTPVRGNSACFTGDSACYAGSHMGTPMDWSEQDQVVCVGEHCSM